VNLARFGAMGSPGAFHFPPRNKFRTARPVLGHTLDMSETTWVLIADASRARVFEHNRSLRSLTLAFEDDRPELRDRSLTRDSDRPGRTQDSAGEGRHGLEPHTSIDDRVREQFSRELVERLQSAANEQRFGQLLLVAPPSMLGAIRKHLGENLRERVIAEIDKDLTRIPAHELPEHLKEWLIVAEPPRVANRT
jgi:protein required for attachment to host cells